VELQNHSRFPINEFATFGHTGANPDTEVLPQKCVVSDGAESRMGAEKNVGQDKMAKGRIAVLAMWVSKG
jgi:hypothetical protein